MGLLLGMLCLLGRPSSHEALLMGEGELLELGVKGAIAEGKRDAFVLVGVGIG